MANDVTLMDQQLLPFLPNMRGIFSGVLLTLFFCVPAIAQFEIHSLDKTWRDPINGLHIGSDSTFSMTFRFRIQNRMEAVTSNHEFWNMDDVSFLTRRLRIRTNGFVANPRIKYYVQLSFTRGDMDFNTTGFPNVVRDAMVFYEVKPNFQIGLGLTKLPGNRQRVISSSEQQFVDRSQLNASLNVDRDHGIFARYRIKSGSASYRLHGAITNGTGRNYEVDKGSSSYSGKVEILPFGDFTLDGDYFEGDLIREQTPKLSIAFAYNYTHNAQRTGVTLGRPFPGSTNVQTMFADALFKYRGFSTYLEFARRESGSIVTPGNDVSLNDIIFEGDAVNVQLSYYMQSGYETAIRFTHMDPGTKLSLFIPEIYDYTLGITRYLGFHRVKIQSDFTYRYATNPILNNLSFQGFWMYRFQVELGI